MIINNTPNVICRGTDTHTYTHKHSQIFSPLLRDKLSLLRLLAMAVAAWRQQLGGSAAAAVAAAARRQRWQLSLSGQLGSGSGNGRGKKNKQSTKSSGSNSDGNGDDDSNDNDNENEGNGVVDGSTALAVAAGWRRQKHGGGGQHN